MGVPPKSPILVGFSLKNHPLWGTPISGNPHIYTYRFIESLTMWIHFL